VPIAVGAALIVTAIAVASGGLPLGILLAVFLALVLAAMPWSPRRYILRRLWRIAASLFVSMALLWVLVHNYRDDSRFDEPGVIPALERYGRWLGDLVAGDLGNSPQYSETVGEGISRTLPVSLQLVIYSQVIALMIALPAAMIGARYRGRASDLAARAVALLGIALPVFITGPILLQLLGIGELNLFGREVGWKLLPVVRYEALGDGLLPHVESMLLPSLTLALNTAAIYLVLMRAELLEQLRLPHALLAQSKGISPNRLVRVHALRPASPATVAAVAAQTGFILGNVIIIERIFTMPGFGDYTLVAIGRRDVLAVVGSVFVAAVILAAVNLIAEALLLAIDPRLESSAKPRSADA